MRRRSASPDAPRSTQFVLQHRGFRRGSRRIDAGARRKHAAASRDGLDAFLFPSVYTYFPVLRAPTVVGVHDVIARRHPELTLPRRRDRAFWLLKERVAVRRAAAVFTVSEASRAELVRTFGLAPERVAVVPEAPDPVFEPRPREAVARALGELGLGQDERIVVYAAGLSPHKNVETLLEAFASLPLNGSAPARLVLAGALEDESFHSAADSIREGIRRLGLGGRDEAQVAGGELEIRPPGHVAEAAQRLLNLRS